MFQQPWDFRIRSDALDLVAFLTVEFRYRGKGWVKEFKNWQIHGFINALRTIIYCEKPRWNQETLLAFVSHSWARAIAKAGIIDTDNRLGRLRAYEKYSGGPLRWTSFWMFSVLNSPTEKSRAASSSRENTYKSYQGNAEVYSQIFPSFSRVTHRCKLIWRRKNVTNRGM